MGSTLHVEETSDSVDVTKTLHLSRLAAVLGRPLVTLNCDGQTTVKNIYSNLLRKSVFRGAISCLTSIDKLNPSVVVHLATMMCAVRNAWYDQSQTKVELTMGNLDEVLHLRDPLDPSSLRFKKGKLAIVAKALQTRPSLVTEANLKEASERKLAAKSSYFNENYLPFGFSFFCTVAPSPNTQTIPLKLQTVMRNVTLSIPSIEGICRSLLLSSGFVSTDRLAPVMVRAIHHVSDHFATEIGVVFYTTIAAAVSAAARHLEARRNTKSEIALELEDTLDVWSEHNDSVEARSLRQALVQTIYQQVLARSDSSIIRERLVVFMKGQFEDFESLHRDPTKPYTKRDEVDNEEEKGIELATQLYYDSCEKLGLISTDGQRDAAVKLYQQFHSDVANGSITVITGVAGSGKSSLYKLVIHMMNGDALKFRGKPNGIGGEYDSREVFREGSTTTAETLLGGRVSREEADRAVVKVQRCARDWLRHRALGATTVYSDAFMKSQGNIVFHLEVIRSGSLDMESLIGCYQDGIWWDGLFLRRLRQLNNIVAQKQTSNLPWKSLVVLDGSSGRLVEQFASSPFHKSQRSVAQDMVSLPANIEVRVCEERSDEDTPATRPARCKHRSNVTNTARCS